MANDVWYADGKKEEITISGTKNNFGGGILITDKNNISIFKNVANLTLIEQSLPLFCCIFAILHKKNHLNQYIKQ